MYRCKICQELLPRENRDGICNDEICREIQKIMDRSLPIRGYTQLKPKGGPDMICPKCKQIHGYKGGDYAEGEELKTVFDSNESTVCGVCREQEEAKHAVVQEATGIMITCH